MSTEVEELLTEARASGLDDDVLAEWLDTLVDWRRVVPGPAGEALEAVDGPALQRLAVVARSALKRIRTWLTDPKRRAEARARREARREARQWQKRAQS